MKQKKMKKGFKALIIVLITIIGLPAAFSVFNSLSANRLFRYIEKEVDTVQYENQLIPYVDEQGYYTLKADRDIKILAITDIHIGGGHWQNKKDRKTLYEVSTMIHNEKPDLVILEGDNTYCLPGPLWGGGGTINNLMSAKIVANFFEKLGVYYSFTFGNHDSEAMGLASRQKVANEYMKDKYEHCIFQQADIDDPSKMKTVTNQCILLKNESNRISKALMLIDSNSYIDNSFMSTVKWRYDVIHDCQVSWAEETINTLSSLEGSLVKSLYFFHIPIGEFQIAYKDFVNNNCQNTLNTKYISGVWNEEPTKIKDKHGNLIDETRVWYGGVSTTTSLEDKDQIFEKLGPDGLNTMEACFVGHDHVNNAVVEYKGVLLSYGNSVDNRAYSGIHKAGLQRGLTEIIVSNDGTWEQYHKNAYLDLGVSKDKFYDVYLDRFLYEDFVPKDYNL